MSYATSEALDDDFLDFGPDEYIFAVQYDENHVIERVKVTLQSLIEEMTEPVAQKKERITIGGNSRKGYTVVDRSEVVRGLESGKTYMTVTFDGDGNFEGAGALVITQKIGKNTWIKTVRNGIEDDNLENLPEFTSMSL